MAEIVKATQTVAKTLPYGQAIRGASLVASGIIATGTMAHLANEGKQKQQVRAQRKRDLKALKKKQKEELKAQRVHRRMIDDIKNVPFELFNERIGHTNMGNARFK